MGKEKRRGAEHFDLERGIDSPMPKAAKLVHEVACTGMQPSAKSFALIRKRSILGGRFPHHVSPLERGGRVYRDIGSSGTLSHSGVAFSEAAEGGRRV